MLRKLELKDVPHMLEWMHDPAVACNFRANFKDMTEQNAIDFVNNSFTEENQNFAFVDENMNIWGLSV